MNSKQLLRQCVLRQYLILHIEINAEVPEELDNSEMTISCSVVQSSVAILVQKEQNVVTVKKRSM